MNSELRSLSCVRYTIDADDKICFVDDGWCEFAEANDGSDLKRAVILGQSIWDHITDSTTSRLYQQIVSRVRQGKLARFTLRCDGPACRRLLEMTITAEADGSVSFETNALRVEDRAPVALLSRKTERSSEMLRMCAWCNRMDAGNGLNTWVEVEDAAERLRLFEEKGLPQLTHGICEACLASMTDTLKKMETVGEPDATPNGGK
ncbi:MAG: hypothetical protein AB7J13_00130 [Pyrinomonadaceae bacterium]